MAKRLPTGGGDSRFQHWLCNADPCAMLSLKYFVDSKAQLVLFAEADMDDVEVLFFDVN
jgi:hypothetical protein